VNVSVVHGIEMQIRTEDLFAEASEFAEVVRHDGLCLIPARDS
jgi:hypothetical protein